DAGDELVAIQPDRLAAAIRKRDRYRKGRLRQIPVDRAKVLVDGWKRLATRRLKCARREEPLERSLGGERLFGLHREAARHWTDKHDRANRRPIADHRFLGETSAVGWTTDIPRHVTQRPPQVDQVGDAGRRVVRQSIDSLLVELADAGAACVAQLLFFLGAFSKVGGR